MPLEHIRTHFLIWIVHCTTWLQFHSNCIHFHGESPHFFHSISQIWSNIERQTQNNQWHSFRKIKIKKKKKKKNKMNLIEMKFQHRNSFDACKCVTNLSKCHIAFEFEHSNIRMKRKRRSGAMRAFSLLAPISVFYVFISSSSLLLLSFVPFNS